MEIIGIIAEYNPFHKGHLYQINKIKELYPESIIIVITSSSFCQRGEISILNKWDKTAIALENKIDLVLELPFVFSSQSADIFAKGALKVLNELKITKLVFGSESNDLETLKMIAKFQIDYQNLEEELQKEKDRGLNYPTALAKVIARHTNKKVDLPNDLLAISYLKEIYKNNYAITPIAIKRTNSYHDLTITDNNIISAQAIRKLEKEGQDITPYASSSVAKSIYKNIDIFPYLKYKILSEDTFALAKYQTVEEGIENKLKKEILNSQNLLELIFAVKSKRFTYNKINRMLIHILTSLTKEEVKDLKVEYIRVLGFNSIGKNYLNKIKKKTSIPIITKYQKGFKNLNIEYRITTIYSLLVNDQNLIKKEVGPPIRKE